MNKKFAVLVSSITLFLCFATGSQALKSPSSIAGITLQTPAESCTPAPETATYLQEKYIEAPEPFRKISILTGNCKRKGQILKIKAKYQDKSKAFFKALHEELAKQYGSKGDWEGDAFGILNSWKWSFKDENGNRVVMSLEYNNKNTELSMGSVLKISYPIFMEEERLCSLRGIKKEQTVIPDIDDIEWNKYIPK